MAQYTPNYLNTIAKPLLSLSDLNLATDFANLFKHSGENLDQAIQQFVHKTTEGLEKIKSDQEKLAASNALEGFLSKTVAHNRQLNEQLNQINRLDQAQKFNALIAFLRSAEYRKYLAKVFMLAHQNRPLEDFFGHSIKQAYDKMNQTNERSADQLNYRLETRIICQAMELCGQLFDTIMEVVLYSSGIRPAPETLVEKTHTKENFRPMPGLKI